ncbi:helix-turn-helix transcriptional regulator [Nocardia brasiliensis]
MSLSQHPVVPRVERQHRLVEELRSHGRWSLTGEILAERLGVCARTIERDVADLVRAGVPIDTQRGPGGGYVLVTQQRSLTVQFTPSEASALLVALTAIGPRASASAQSAMAKLVAALTGGEPECRP